MNALEGFEEFMGKVKIAAGARQEAVAKLRQIAVDAAHDPEAAHSDADKVLCDLLSACGMDDVVTEWKAVKKYY